MTDKRIALRKRFTNVDIYPVTCEPLSNGRSDIDVLNNIVQAGVKIIQLRDKLSSKKSLYEKACSFRKICYENDMLLIVNDHLDIALACNADGIHLGQSDLPVEVVRNLAPDLLIGISTHNLNEVKAIMNSDVDYHNIGPIFKTNTKNCQSDYLGIEAIQQLKFDFPFSVMGGIKRHHFPDLVAAGVCRIAMVSEITQAENICKHVQILRSELIKLLAEKNIT